MSACWELLHSEAFFLLLSNFTGLRLHYLCPADDEENNDEEKAKKEEEDGEATGSSNESSSANASREKGVHASTSGFLHAMSFACFDLRVLSEPSTPVCCGEVRRWSHGSYTLLHDGEAARAEYALDLVLPFGCAGEFTHSWRTNFQV